MVLSLVATILAAEPVLPVDQSPWAPGQLSQDQRGKAPSANVDDVKVCGSCLMDVAAQWRTSAHALASFTGGCSNIEVFHKMIKGKRRYIGSVFKA